jgi:hypothetical protein
MGNREAIVTFVGGISDRPAEFVEARHGLRRWYRIINPRKVFLYRPHRLEQGDQAGLAYWLDHQTITVAMHCRFVARKLEFHRNSSGLTMPIADQFDSPLILA